MPDIVDEHNLPVQLLAGEDINSTEEGVGLCLSGGGYRAMLFHVGTLWRLYELGLLNNINRISSVSGGSITSAVLALAWAKLSFDPANINVDFVPHVVTPIRKMAGKTIDRTSVIGGIFTPGSISDKIVSAYKKHLFGDKTLQDMPDAPRFVINATNVQSGVLWRFMKPYMRDWRVGQVSNPTVELADAVAASSAFPPVLSPHGIELDPDDFDSGTGADLQHEPYTSEIVLTDGGVYDNLGLETCFKRYSKILVSDAGGKLEAEQEPKIDWARHSYRVLNIIDNQVRSLRKRQLIHAYQTKLREGAYWGIRTDIKDYNLSDAMDCPFEWSTDLARTPTRLKRLPAERQKALINWGYAVCDAAVRAHFKPDAKPPGGFPYPNEVPQ